MCPRPMCYKAYGSGKEDSPLCDAPGCEKGINCRWCTICPGVCSDEGDEDSDSKKELHSTSSDDIDRSFDVNKWGLRSLMLKVVLLAEEWKCKPIYTRVVSLFADKNGLQFVVPGGLIGVGTTMDPTLTKSNSGSSLLKIHQYPLDLGHFWTLEAIQLSGCNSSKLESALEIHKEQHSIDDDFLKFSTDQKQHTVGKPTDTGTGVPTVFFCLKTLEFNSIDFRNDVVVSFVF
ncbi:eukaryotic translation initiation factor 2 subunit gamma-like protein [Tanacetum coccineum]